MNKSYVLITPARNEAQYIEKTICSVIFQTILPEKWIIVDDGSTDGTDKVVGKYSARHSFIQLVRVSNSHIRNFASKVNAFKVGYEKLNALKYDFIGNLDADVSFEPDYYEKILEKFVRNAELGIAGGFIYEDSNGKFKSRPSNTVVSVAGAIQLFRRECYEAIGGHVPIEVGGEDWYLEVLARMKGWQVESFPKLKVCHHKQLIETGGKLSRSFKEGKKDYLFGSHSLFEIMKCIRRIKEQPYLLSAVFRISGFMWAACKSEKRVVPDEFMNYLREEQILRLKSFFHCNSGML